MFDEFTLIYIVRNFIDDNLIMCRMRFDFSLGTHDYTATTCFIRFTYTTDTIDITTCREVRCLDELHQSICIYLIIIDISHTSIDYFGQVMSRHIGSHTHGNTRCTVHQEVRDACRHHGRFLEGIVEVIGEVYGFLVKVCHQVFAHLLQTCFSITHSRSTISVDRTKVTLSVNQWVSHGPILCHTNQCTIY